MGSPRGGFTSVETLERIEESRAARLPGDYDQYRALSLRTRALLRRDKTNDLRHAYRALKNIRSKSTFQVSAIRKVDGCLVSDAGE